MRYHGVVVERLGSVVGDVVARRRAAHNGQFGKVRATGQKSIAVCAGRTGPQLAVQAARQALAGETGPITLHLHATIHDPGLDFWSASGYVADQSGVDVRMTMSLNAMSNSVIAGMELAAGVLTAQRADGRALITSGDVFAPPRFDAWHSDSGIAYGDGAAAVLLGCGPPRPALADLVSTASHADPELEGLHRGDAQWYSGRVFRPPIRLRERKKQWLAARRGADEVDLRNAIGINTVTKHALEDAEIDLSDLRWVLCPNYGAPLLERQCLAPLGIGADRTLACLGRRYGHMGASDQIVALHHLQRHRLAAPGDYVMLLGIGVGMTWTAAILRLNGEDSGVRRAGERRPE